ncbi:hypothetical protein [Metabacillus fastidiosus]|uniref:hypothetical protein n=1 Tax=Metabacillus fastidiosus TaxID=1458 RepID=UPI000824BD78|nr:hypothetical protein [Metabacillus fastidiosus]
MSKNQRLLVIILKFLHQNRGFYEKDPLWKPVSEKEAKLSETKVVVIQIEGNVLVSGFKESMKIIEFIDEFSNFLESRGWSFGSEIKQVSPPINKK